MRKLLVVVLVSVNFVVANMAFILYLNWYDTGLLDFSGWMGMSIGGTTFGVAFALLQIYRRRSAHQEGRLLYYTQQVLINGIGLICSFAFGCFVELLIQVNGVAEIAAIFPTILMIPFAVYLGITNGFLSRMAYNVCD